jgi:hypothetical protein
VQNPVQFLGVLEEALCVDYIERLLKIVYAMDEVFAALDKGSAALAPIEPERFAANTGPAKVFFEWAQHDMYISRKSADKYFNGRPWPEGTENGNGTPH